MRRFPPPHTGDQKKKAGLQTGMQAGSFLCGRAALQQLIEEIGVAVGVAAGFIPAVDADIAFITL